MNPFRSNRRNLSGAVVVVLMVLGMSLSSCQRKYGCPTFSIGQVMTVVNR